MTSDYGGMGLAKLLALGWNMNAMEGDRPNPIFLRGFSSLCGSYPHILAVPVAVQDSDQACLGGRPAWGLR